MIYKETLLKNYRFLPIFVLYFSKVSNNKSDFKQFKVLMQMQATEDNFCQFFFFGKK